MRILGELAELVVIRIPVERAQIVDFVNGHIAIEESMEIVIVRVPFDAGVKAEHIARVEVLHDRAALATAAPAIAVGQVLEVRVVMDGVTADFLGVGDPLTLLSTGPDGVNDVGSRAFSKLEGPVPVGRRFRRWVRLGNRDVLEPAGVI